MTRFVERGCCIGMKRPQACVEKREARREFAPDLRREASEKGKPMPRSKGDAGSLT